MAVAQATSSSSSPVNVSQAGISVSSKTKESSRGRSYGRFNQKDQKIKELEEDLFDIMDELEEERAKNIELRKQLFKHRKEIEAICRQKSVDKIEASIQTELKKFSATDQCRLPLFAMFPQDLSTAYTSTQTELSNKAQTDHSPMYDMFSQPEPTAHTSSSQTNVNSRANQFQLGTNYIPMLEMLSQDESMIHTLTQTDYKKPKDQYIYTDLHQVAVMDIEPATKAVTAQTSTQTDSSEVKLTRANLEVINMMSDTRQINLTLTKAVTIVDIEPQCLSTLFEENVESKKKSEKLPAKVMHLLAAIVVPCAVEMAYTALYSW